MHLICIILHFPHLNVAQTRLQTMRTERRIGIVIPSVSHFAVRQLKSKASPQPVLHLRSFHIIFIPSVFRSPPRNRPRIQQNRDDFPIFNSLLPGDKRCQRPWLVQVANWYMHSNARYRHDAPVADCQRRQCKSKTKTVPAKASQATQLHLYYFIFIFVVRRVASRDAP